MERAQYVWDNDWDSGPVHPVKYRVLLRRKDYYLLIEEPASADPTRDDAFWDRVEKFFPTKLEAWEYALAIAQKHGEDTRHIKRAIAMTKRKETSNDA